LLVFINDASHFCHFLIVNLNFYVVVVRNDLPVVWGVNDATVATLLVTVERERERGREREREGGGGCDCRYAICHQINLRDSLYQMKYIDDGGQL
jgi:hypothetical protein